MAKLDQQKSSQTPFRKRVLFVCVENSCRSQIADSKSLSNIPAFEYDVAVTMGCGDACPNVRAKQREEWAIPDPKAMSSEEFRKVRNRIEDKVKALLANL